MSLDATLEDLLRKVIREERVFADSSDPLLTSEEVAEYLRYSEHQIRRLNKEGKLKGFMLGGNSLRFRRSEVEKFIREREQAA